MTDFLAFKTNIYPFTEFHAIISHVHPRFVLYDAGSKVFDNSPAIDDIEAAPQLEPIVEKISEIYESWTARKRLLRMTAGTTLDKHVLL